MVRPWLSYNPDPISGLRSTRTRQRLLPQRRNIHGLYSQPAPRYETYQQPIISPSEIIDTIRERFSQQPLTRRGDIVTRSMAKPEMPLEMAGKRRFGSYFQPQVSDFPVGAQGYRFTPTPSRSDMLTTSWIAPKGEGPTSMQRNIPASDRARALAYGAGISGVGTRASYLNPSTHWPESAFKVPVDVEGLPVFGATIDYSTGKWYRPPSSWGRTQQYGRFGAGRKTTPTFGGTYRPSAREIRYARRRLDWRKALRKDAEAKRKEAEAKSKKEKRRRRTQPTRKSGWFRPKDWRPGGRIP